MHFLWEYRWAVCNVVWKIRTFSWNAVLCCHSMRVGGIIKENTDTQTQGTVCKPGESTVSSFSGHTFPMCVFNGLGSVHVWRLAKTSSNSLPATFLSFPSDQSLYSGTPAAAGPSPLSFSLDVKENKDEPKKDRQRSGGWERKMRWEERTGVDCAVRSCLMRTLDLPQTDGERKAGSTQPK